MAPGKRRCTLRSTPEPTNFKPGCALVVSIDVRCPQSSGHIAGHRWVYQSRLVSQYGFLLEEHIGATS